MVSRGLVILLGLVMTSSQGDEDPELLRSRIGAEIEGLGRHPWAGIYEYHLDTPMGDLGPLVRLDLAPRSGYVLERRVGCFLTPVISDGAVIVEGGRLRLRPRIPVEPRPPFVGGMEGHSDPLAGELLPLALGGRRHLLPAAQVTEFCNAVNSGYKRGPSLLRRGDGDPETLRDELPPEVSRCLLNEPVRGRIVSVGNVQGHGPGESLPGSTRKLQTGWGDLPVVLDVGARDGVWVGMELYSVCPPCSYQPAEVISVGERTSEAVFRAEWLATTPEAGWLMSTRAGDPLD